VKLPPPFGILQQQRIYCKHDDGSFPSDIIARVVKQQNMNCIFKYIFFINTAGRSSSPFHQQNQNNNKVGGANSGSVSPNADSMFKELCPLFMDSLGSIFFK
jgi:hypothetical protein